MELNSIINNNTISGKMKDIYKFIDKNDDKITEIFNRAFQDIKNIFSDVELHDDMIEILNVDNIDEKRNECYNILTYHSRSVLAENSYIVSYAFKISILKDTIKIIKKH